MAYVRLKYQTHFHTVLALCSVQNLSMLCQEKDYKQLWILSIFLFKSRVFIPFEKLLHFSSVQLVFLYRIIYLGQFDSGG